MNKRSVAFLLAALAVLALAVAGGVHFRSRRAPAGASAMSSVVRPSRGQTYYCPMHPTMISDHPADCPICQMRMVPRDDDRPVDAGVATVPGPSSGATAGP